MKLRPLLLPLVSGILIGSAAAWWLPGHTSTPVADGTSSEPPQAPVAILIRPERLASADADTAVREWLALPELAEDSPQEEQAARRLRLRALLTRLPDNRLSMLMDALVTREIETECALRRLVFEVWTERDAPAAAQWASGRSTGHYTQAHRRDDVTLATRSWANTDWDGAYLWATKLTDGELSPHLANVLLEQLAAHDPGRAITLAQSRGDEFFKSAREKILKAWSQTSPGDAIRWFIPHMTADDHSRWTLLDAATRWIAANPTEAVDVLVQTKGSEDDDSRSLLESTFHQVTSRPDAARGLAGVLLRRDDLADQNRLLARLLGHWQQSDPIATLAWLDTIKDGTKRGELVDQVARTWGFISEKTRLEFNLRLPEGAQRDETIKNTLTSWAKAAPDDALAWLEKHPNSGYTQIVESIQGVIVGNLAATDLPAALGRWETLPDGDAKQSAVGPIIDAWSKQDPAAAAAWLLPRVDLKRGNSLSSDDPMQKLMRRWSANDPATALRWVESHPDKNTRQVLANAFTNHFGDADAPDPRARAALYATIRDEDLRKRLLQSHAWSWLHTNYKAAGEWLESSDAFTPEQVARMLVEQDPYRNR